MYHFYKNIFNGIITDAVFAGDNIYTVSPSKNQLVQIQMRNKETYARDIAQLVDKAMREDVAKLMNREGIFGNQKQAEDYQSNVEANDKYDKSLITPFVQICKSQVKTRDTLKLHR